MPFSYSVEKKVAVAAVLRACSLTSSVFKNLVQGETITKDDKSPVTSASAVEKDKEILTDPI